MAHLSIQLLGPFHVTLGGEPITSFESNKVRALLAYLAMEPHHARSRETLAGFLWPDQAEAAARHNLRQALSNLRQALCDRDADPPFLHITHRTVQFNPDSDYDLDASRFEAIVAATEAHAHARLETCERCLRPLEEAVALYRGGFLEGLFVDDSVSFEEWALLRRERLHRLALDKLFHLAKHSERRRDYARAQRYAQRQVELEPWREEAHQQLMRVLARSGQRSTALAQYERCRRILAEELGVEPDGQTQALYDRIRATRGACRHNLPAQLTPFFGRKEDLAEIAERLENPACRLLTLVGPGGTGKSRLALQAADEQIGAFLNGVFFVPLAAVSSPRFLAATIADAAGLVFSGEAGATAQLLDYLRSKEMLLVIDSFEHLLAPATAPTPGPPLTEGSQHPGGGSEAAVSLLLAILTAAPCIKILVTSREPLHLRAEWLFAVGGLAVPGLQETDGIETYSAVQLFVDTARRVDASLALASDTLPCVVRICRLLEGMPLGIELAAAAIRAWPCEQIAAQIEQDLDFLTTSMRDVPARHRSMRVVFDHSWRLLSAAEQEAVARLSVFRNPFRPEAARAVAGARPEMLASLVNRSFLSKSRAARVHMHPLLKQYSVQKLAQIPEREQETRTLHSRYYAGFLHARREALKGARQPEVLAEIGEAIEDVRAAWQWAVTYHDLAAITLAMESLFHFYWVRNWFQEGTEAIEQAAAAVEASSERDDVLLARIGTHQAEFYIWLGRYDEARTLLHRSVAICRAARAQQDLATALTTLGELRFWMGDYAAAGEVQKEALRIFREVGDRYWMAHCLNSLAILICEESADLEQARPLYEESLALARQVGDQIGEAKVLLNQGASAHERADYAGAQRLYGESLALYRALDYRRGISAVLNNLGQVARALGDYASARNLLTESLDIKRETGNRSAMLNSLLELGNLTCLMGRYDESSRWYRQTLALAWEIQAVHMVRYAVAGVAELLERQDRRERALELLYFVQHEPVGEQALLDQVTGLVVRLEEALTPETVARCREQGQAITLEALMLQLSPARGGRIEPDEWIL